MLEQLYSLFAEVARPTRAEMGAKGTEEWGVGLDCVSSKPWQEITLNDFKEVDGGILELASILSAKGTIYYIPGFLRIAIEEDDEDDRYWVLSALLNKFTSPGYLQPGIENITAMKSLSQEQRSFIADALKELCGSIDTICPVLVDSAIDNLGQGVINRYSQKDVDAWVKDWTERFEINKQGSPSREFE